FQPLSSRPLPWQPRLAFRQPPFPRLLSFRLRLSRQPLFRLRPFSRRQLFLRQPSSRLMPFAQRLSFPPALFLRPLSFRPPLFLQPLFSRQVPFLRRLSSVQRPFRQQLSLLQLFPLRLFPRPGDVLPLRVFFALRALSRWQYPDPPLEPGGALVELAAQGRVEVEVPAAVRVVAAA